MRVVWIAVLAIICAACGAKNDSPPSSEARALSADAVVTPLTISEISENPSGKYPRYRALMEDLFEDVSVSGYDGTDIRIYPDSPQLFEAVGEGKTQLILEGAYSVLCAASLLEGETLLINAKDRRILFQSYFIVLDSSPLEGPEDLTAKVLALEDSESTSGYFAPLVTLKRKGLAYVKSELPKDNAVSVYLAGEDELILRDLFAGTADCGVLPDYEWDELEPEVRGKLRILLKSEPMPRSLLLLSPDLSDGDREALSSYFLSMKENPAKEPVLEKLKSGGFYRVEDVFDPAELDELTGYCDELGWQ